MDTELELVPTISRLEVGEPAELVGLVEPRAVVPNALELVPVMPKLEVGEPVELIEPDGPAGPVAPIVVEPMKMLEAELVFTVE